MQQPISRPVKGIAAVGPTGLAVGQNDAPNNPNTWPNIELFGLKQQNTKFTQPSSSEFLQIVLYLIYRREFAPNLENT